MTVFRDEAGQMSTSVNFVSETSRPRNTFSGSAHFHRQSGQELPKGCSSMHPSNWQQKSKAVEIITEMIDGARAEHKKGVKTMIILVLGDIWQWRNECTFRQKIASLTETMASITRTFELWRQAGATHLEHPFWDPP